MKTIDLEKKSIGLPDAIKLAGKGPVLLVAAGGREYVLSAADDFEQEVAVLRKSRKFQRFLDERSRSVRSISLAEVEHRIESELNGRKKTR